MRMSELLNEVNAFELDEGFSPKEIKMAIGIASDPRYAKGNMTGAVNSIEKMKKGLSKHPQVAAVLKRQNEGFASDAQRKAAFASGYKEKDKKDKKEGNAFGMALKAARDNDEKTFVVSGKKYNVEDYDIKEDGHTDVASAVRQCKTMVEDATQIMSKLQTMSPEESLPSWWTNKLAIASNNMNKLRDYFLVPTNVTEELQEAMGDLEDLKKMVAELEKASEMHLGQSKRVQAHVDMMSKMEEVELDEAVENILIQKGDVNKIAMQVAKNAKMLGLKSAHMGPHVRVKGAKKQVSNFMSTVIGRNSTGDATSTGMVTPMIDKMLNKSMKEEVNEMAYKPGSFKDTKPQEKAAKAFDNFITQAKRYDDLDLKDYQKARSLYVQASDPSSREKLKKFIFNLDTEPKELVMNLIGVNDPNTFLQMYPDAKEGEPLTRTAFKHRSMKSEETKLDEMNMKYVLINMQGKVQGYASDKKDALDIARRTKSTMHPIKKKISDKTLEKMNALSKTPKELADLGIIDMEMSIKKKLNMGEEVKLGEAFKPDQVKAAISIARDNRFSMKGMVDKKTAIEKIAKGLSKDPAVKKVLDKMYEEFQLKEKYDIYHKDFSSAMQHAYSYAKSKMGITIDPKEIDSKVATGPKKPTEGKTNKYRLKGKGGNLQIQVYNKGGSKPFELNMYKEENELISQASKYISHMQMAEKIDPADVDDDASEKDIENAAKNIIMQLRKSVSMRGNKDVEFASGKQKVDMRIAQKAISIHMKMKPQDKLSFQNTIAKSYKDLLNAVKGK